MEHDAAHRERVLLAAHEQHQFPGRHLAAAVLQPERHDAVNLGAIGVVIGHELTHGFDDQGRRYDGEGNLRDWWTAADAKAFETRADCIANEYGSFSPAPGVNLNGKLTLGENAADNGGIHLAYMALMDSLAGKVLPEQGRLHSAAAVLSGLRADLVRERHGGVRANERR